MSVKYTSPISIQYKDKVQILSNFKNLIYLSFTPTITVSILS